MQFRFIDLFAGIGGFRIALESLGENVFSSEWDKFAQRPIMKILNEIPSGDITKISSDEIQDFDVLTAVFLVSHLVALASDKVLNTLLKVLCFDVLRIIRIKNPRHLFLKTLRVL